MSKPKVVAAALLLALAFAGVSNAAGPSLSIIGPTQGEVIRGDSVTVQFKLSAFEIASSTVPVSEAGKRPDANVPLEGHVHITLDLQPLVVLEREEAYTFQDVAPGQHQITIELANNDHSPLSPPVVQQVRFEPFTNLPATGTGLELPPDTWWALPVVGAGLLLVGLTARRLRRRRA